MFVLILCCHIKGHYKMQIVQYPAYDVYAHLITLWIVRISLVKLLCLQIKVQILLTESDWSV